MWKLERHTCNICFDDGDPREMLGGHDFTISYNGKPIFFEAQNSEKTKTMTFGDIERMVDVLNSLETQI